MTDQQYKDCAEEILGNFDVSSTEHFKRVNTLIIVGILKKHFAFKLDESEIPPDVDIVICKGTLIGLSETECRKFHAFYESNGWKVGRNKMKSWKGALAGWAFRREGDGCLKINGKLTDAAMIAMTKERDRIAERLKVIKGQASHDAWGAHYDKRQLVEIDRLKTRDNELKKQLGVTI